MPPLNRSPKVNKCLSCLFKDSRYRDTIERHGNILQRRNEWDTEGKDTIAMNGKLYKRRNEWDTEGKDTIAMNGKLYKRRKEWIIEGNFIIYDNESIPKLEGDITLTKMSVKKDVLIIHKEIQGISISTKYFIYFYDKVSGTDPKMDKFEWK